MEAPEPRRAGPEEPRGGGPREAARIAAIVAAGRATRRGPSRPTWIAAGIIGAICALGFVLLLLLGGAPRERASASGAPEPARGTARGAGCAGGFGLGLGLGIAIGFALARRPSSAPRAQDADHSSRKRP
jgi:hypothetical protein